MRPGPHLGPAAPGPEPGEPAPQREALLPAAIAAGLLPRTATWPPAASRPWPVVLLTALGAWLAAIPLLAVIAILLGDVLREGGSGPYVAGLLMLAGSLVVLRARELPPFVEQLAVPALIAGGGGLAFGLFRDLPTAGAAASMCLVALAVACVVRAGWLRVLLGAGAAAMFVVAVLPVRWQADERLLAAGVRQALHLGLAAWLGLLVLQRRWPGRRLLPRARSVLDDVAAGWLLLVLAELAGSSGRTFLAGGALGVGGDAAELMGTAAAGRAAQAAMALPQGISAALALAGALWLARCWPALRQAAPAGAAAVLVVLAWFMPALGAVLLALAVCVTQSRWRLATAAGLVAAWVAGAFYYALAWPLATKAVVLVAAGAACGGLGWWMLRGPAPGDARAPGSRAGLAGGGMGPGTRRARLGIAATVLAVLAVANAGIWQKESLIAHGRPVYIELAPVDPRSLVQGDYMRLAFRLPGNLPDPAQGGLFAPRPRVVARLDPRGVATLQDLHGGGLPAEGELLIELTPKEGRWTVASDAWFFAEGEAERWARARYGEFRIDASGRALLVALRGPALEDLGARR